MSLRFAPPADADRGVGAVVLGGSSGRVDEPRARLLADAGATTEAVPWFGGPGLQPGPWEVPLELIAERAAALRAHCDRVSIVGLSFGAEAALATAALVPGCVDAVAAFAPSDLVWAGVTDDGRVTSHWTLDGVPLPHVPFDDTWEPATDPPAYDELYRSSRRRFAEQVSAATIPVERIGEVLLVAGGDDRVWPALDHADAIVERRAAHGLTTQLVTDPDAGHRAVLPGEPVVTAGQRMARGGTEDADRRLGAAAWPALRAVVGVA